MPMPDVLRRKVLAAGARCASLRICTQGNVVECAPGQPRPYTYDASSRELSRGFSGEEGNEEEGSNDENVPPATDLHDSNDRHELARTRAGKPGTQSPLRSLVSDCPQTRSSPSLLPSVHVDLQGPFNSRFLLPQPHPSKDNKLCVVLDIDETLVCGYSANAVPRHMQEDSRVGYRLRAFNLHCAVGEDASLYADKSLTERGLASESASGAITAVASSTGDGGGDAAAEHISITVFERPGLAAFLHELERFAEVIVFTAGVQGYARPLTDAIDPEGYITGRLYRDACVSTRYSDHVKDLLRIGRDLRKTVLVDNNPLSFLLQPHNGVPAVPFTGDPNDAYLETHLMPVLQDLAVAVEGGKDVRPILAGGQSRLSVASKPRFRYSIRLPSRSTETRQASYPRNDLIEAPK